MGAEAGRNYRTEVGTALAAAINITGISKASEAVVTATNTYTNGDYVLLSDIDGMPEISGIVARVKAVSGTGFTLEGVDSSAVIGTFIAGTVRKITTWTTLAQATQVDFGTGSVESLPATTLLDVKERKQAGVLSQPDVTVSLFTDYSAAAQVAIDAAAKLGAITPFRFTKNSGHKRVTAGVPSDIGENVPTNAMITGQFTFLRTGAFDVKYTT